MNAMDGIIRAPRGNIRLDRIIQVFQTLWTLVQGLTVDDIVNHLNGSLDPAHDFSAYLDDTSLTQLADFLKFGIIDDTTYIDPISLQVIDPDFTHGKKLYQSTCQHLPWGGW